VWAASEWTGIESVKLPEKSSLDIYYLKPNVSNIQIANIIFLTVMKAD